ncbi:prepilin-type N-terminal cleavage/methylation domain-containing protein [Pseudomonas luteola]|nr:prepilin-type N-terminal cleavage/methylation domain-containing protein [Pseudomonas luteola]
MARGKPVTGQRRPRSEGGFTLLELLAAVALLAVTFFVLMGGIGQATHALLKDSRATQMALTARSLLDDTVHRPLKPGSSQGSLPDGTRWKLDISKAGAATTSQLYRLDLSLTAGRHQERFSTLRLQGVSEVSQ